MAFSILPTHPAHNIISAGAFCCLFATTVQADVQTTVKGAQLATHARLRDRGTYTHQWWTYFSLQISLYNRYTKREKKAKMAHNYGQGAQHYQQQRPPGPATVDPNFLTNVFQK